MLRDYYIREITPPDYSPTRRIPDEEIIENLTGDYGPRARGVFWDVKEILGNRTGAPDDPDLIEIRTKRILNNRA